MVRLRVPKACMGQRKEQEDVGLEHDQLGVCFISALISMLMAVGLTIAGCNHREARHSKALWGHREQAREVGIGVQ